MIRDDRDGANDPFDGVPDLDDRLADWIDGRMSARELERFEAEMRVSKKLREQAAEYRATVGSVREALQAPVHDVALADRVMGRLAQQHEAPSMGARARVLPLLGALLTAAALLGIAIWVDAFGSSPTATRRVDDVAAAGDRSPAMSPGALQSELKRLKQDGEGGVSDGSLAVLVEELDDKRNPSEGQAAQNDVAERLAPLAPDAAKGSDSSAGTASGEPVNRERKSTAAQAKAAVEELEREGVVEVGQQKREANESNRDRSPTAPVVGGGAGQGPTGGGGRSGPAGPATGGPTGPAGPGAFGEKSAGPPRGATPETKRMRRAAEPGDERQQAAAGDLDGQRPSVRLVAGDSEGELLPMLVVELAPSDGIARSERSESADKQQPPAVAPDVGGDKAKADRSAENAPPALDERSQRVAQVERFFERQRVVTRPGSDDYFLGRVRAAGDRDGERDAGRNGAQFAIGNVRVYAVERSEQRTETISGSEEPAAETVDRDWLIEGPRAEVVDVLRELRALARRDGRTLRGGEVRVAFAAEVPTPAPSASPQPVRPSQPAAGSATAGASERIERVVVRFRLLPR